MNAIANNPVTTDDINLAEKIFGRDIGAIKGKTTRRKPVPVVDDYIDNPRELIASQYAVKLCVDLMNVNGLNFVTTISKNLQYRTAQYIKDKTPTEYTKALIEVIQVYSKGGFQVTHILCDNEFKPLMAYFAQNNQDIHVNYTSPNEHVPEIERSIRVIKERIRATYHRLPYNHLPKIMIKMLVSESAKKLNYFPSKHGVSHYYSPRMILHQKGMDYKKHCVFAFGTYVQAHDEPKPKKSSEARTLDCIYLRYSDNIQGGHEVLHLPTNKIVKRQYITPSPITPSIIKQVHDIAIMENMPEGLKIKNKTGNLLYDHAWIAGVDYDHQDTDTDDTNTNVEGSNQSDIEFDYYEYDQMEPDNIGAITNENRIVNNNPSIVNNDVNEEYEVEPEQQDEEYEIEADELNEHEIDSNK
jgi:hypothetical protein